MLYSIGVTHFFVGVWELADLFEWACGVKARGVKCGIPSAWLAFPTGCGGWLKGFESMCCITDQSAASEPLEGDRPDPQISGYSDVQIW